MAITLRNIADGCKSARNSIYANRAYLVRQFARADRILIDLRRVIDSENDRRKKMVDARKLADEWQRVMRGINDALAAETLIAASESLTKDWHAAGLPVAAANAITQNFDGIADIPITSAASAPAIFAASRMHGRKWKAHSKPFFVLLLLRKSWSSWLLLRSGITGTSRR